MVPLAYHENDEQRRRMFGSVGKSNAKVYMEKKTGITFADVAGEEEAKESVTELVDFLHNPGKYTELVRSCQRVLYLRPSWNW